MQKTRALAAPKEMRVGSLLCAALSPHDDGATIVVGGERATALVFDLRAPSSRVTAHALSASTGCFDADDAVNAVAFNPTRPHALYCASGARVDAWDLRALPSTTTTTRSKSKSKSTSPSSGGGGSALGSPLHRYAFNADEINSIVIDAKGGAMACADDAGEVVAVDVSSPSSVDGKLLKRLRVGGHSNIASGACFREHKPWDVVSGGLDCAIVKWDRSRASAVASWRVSDLAAEDDAAAAAADDDDAAAAAASTSNAMNPPMVHAVAVASAVECGAALDPRARRLVAAACGDGTVALVDVDLPAAAARGAGGGKGKSKRGGAGGGGDASGGNGGGAFGGARRAVFLGRRGGGHASACTAVRFPGRFDGARVLSGGNDGVVKLWDWRVAAGMADSGADSGADAGADAAPAPPAATGLVCETAHGRKVNALTCRGADAAGGGGGDWLFVCDTSSRLSAYALRG